MCVCVITSVFQVKEKMARFGAMAQAADDDDSNAIKSPRRLAGAIVCCVAAMSCVYLYLMRIIDGDDNVRSERKGNRAQAKPKQTKFVTLMVRA
jgi:hypothetical protein